MAQFAEYIDQSLSNFGEGLKRAADNIDSALAKGGRDLLSDSDSDEDDGSGIAPLPQLNTTLSSDDSIGHESIGHESQADTVVMDNRSRNRGARLQQRLEFNHSRSKALIVCSDSVEVHGASRDDVFSNKRDSIGDECDQNPYDERVKSKDDSVDVRLADAVHANDKAASCHKESAENTAKTSSRAPSNVGLRDDRFQTSNEVTKAPSEDAANIAASSLAVASTEDGTEASASWPLVSINDIVDDLEELKATVMSISQIVDKPNTEVTGGEDNHEAKHVADSANTSVENSSSKPNVPLQTIPPPPEDLRDIENASVPPASCDRADSVKEEAKKRRCGFLNKKRRMFALVFVILVLAAGFTYITLHHTGALAGSNAPPATSTLAENAKQLTFIGSIGPFEVCEGDCDVDSDCQAELVCFLRDEFAEVPGCYGDGKRDVDYCIDPRDMGSATDVAEPNGPTTKAPTSSPTSPTGSIFFAETFYPTLKPTKVPSLRPSQKPTLVLAEIPATSESTPCAESSTEMFKYQGNSDEVVTTSCRMLDLRAEGTEEVCNSAIVSDSGDTVRTLCPLTCGDCDSIPEAESTEPMQLAAPTLRPSLVPTKMETISPTSSQFETFSFYVMGNVPYSAEEEALLKQQLSDIGNGVNEDDALFMIHVGDIFSSPEYLCARATYRRMGNILLNKSPLPVMVLPGDNDWSECTYPSTAWVFWTDIFVDFEQNWQNTNGIASTVTRSKVREENFAFSQSGVLFLGINTGGASRDVDKDEYDLREEQCYDWVKKNVESGTHRAVFVFGHIYRFKIIFEMLSKDVSKRGIPVVFFYGDGRSWDMSQPFDDLFWKVQVDQGGHAPPVKVTVRGETEEEPFNARRKDQIMFGDSVRVDRRGGVYDWVK